MTARRSALGMPFLLTFPSSGEGEHRLDQLLEAERGPDLADEMRGLLADVAEPVRGSRRDEHPVAGPGDELPLAEPELELAGDDLEGLLLRRVDVGGGDGAVRLDVRLDDDALAVGVGRGRAEHERLAGDGVRDGLAGGDHVVSSWSKVVLTRRTIGDAA